MPKSLSLAHVHLPADNPERLRKWYKEKLGFTVQSNLLWSGGTLLAFSKAKRLNNPMVHFGFRFSRREELREWYEHLKTVGLDPPEPEGDDEYECFRINDPEGNEIEFFYELPPGE